MRLINWNAGVMLIVAIIVISCRTSSHLSKTSFSVIDSLPLLPAPAAIPDVGAPLPAGTVPFGDPASFDEVKMNFPMAAGPFKPTWNSISENYGDYPAWLREAKFGFWVHFGPQAAGMSGDWYARRLYLQGQTAYKNHIKDYGHPSENGYKDLLHTWNPTKLDPAWYVKLYHDAGARFLSYKVYIMTILICGILNTNPGIQ
jgi:alpha-L-fucosidase